MSRLDEDPNVYRVSYNRALDFCVWAIERDGLAVSPFDRHKDGDGSLRVVGLDAEGWRAWIHAVAEGTVERWEYQAELSRQSGQAGEPYARDLLDWLQRIQTMARGAPESRPSRARLALVFMRSGIYIPAVTLRAMLAGWAARRRVPMVPFPDAVALWPGNDIIGARIAELYEYYRKHRRSPRRRYWKSKDLLLGYLNSPRFRAFVSESDAQLSEDPAGRLVCIVNYPGPVIDLVTPRVAVIGVRNWNPSPDEFERIARDALELPLQPR